MLLAINLDTFPLDFTLNDNENNDNKHNNYIPIQNLCKKES